MRNKGLRMCVICRAHKPKSELIRIVYSNDIVIDEKQKSQCRGIYICKDKNCCKYPDYIGKIGRALKKELNNEQKELLKSYIENIWGNNGWK